MQVALRLCVSPCLCAPASLRKEKKILNDRLNVNMDMTEFFFLISLIIQQGQEHKH
jgi:hypothetical protein